MRLIAADLFPHLNVDVLLLEYDTSRAGDFGPLRRAARDVHGARVTLRKRDNFLFL
jgi:hypothetical protein